MANGKPVSTLLPRENRPHSGSPADFQWTPGGVYEVESASDTETSKVATWLPQVSYFSPAGSTEMPRVLRHRMVTLPSVATLPPARISRFRALASWEGVVDEIREEIFFARLVALSGVAGEQTAEFELREVSPSDAKLVELGAVFYWTIGYRDNPDGQRETVSQIRFRRLPAWSIGELEAVAGRTRRLVYELRD